MAKYSASQEQQHAADRTTKLPWAISAIAKESALRGNEHRTKRIDHPGFNKLLNAFNSSSDLIPGQSAASILTPILYEQFPYQESLYEEMARTHALLVDDISGLDRIPWEETLGIGLDAAIRSSILLHAWTVRNEGRFERATLDRPDFQEVFEKIAPRHEIEATITAMAASVAELKQLRVEADERAPIPPILERYAFNPLRSRPLVDLGRTGMWSPQTMLIPRAFTSANLYYRGLSQWGKSFADGLGERTQAYVGRQLRLMPGVALYSEIEYARSQYSVDWIWVSKSAVFLIECKAARLTIDAQAGGESLSDVLRRYIGRARAQIDITATLVRERNPAFAHIPDDRPIYRVITTAEAFYLANTPFSGFNSSGTTPVVTLSLRELEFLVGLSEPQAATVIVDHAHPDGEGGRVALDDAIRKRENPILAEAWTHYAFLVEGENDQSRGRSQGR